MDHPFEIGKEYRNRRGKYEVVAVEGDDMIIHFDDGTVVETTVSLQQRILERIADDELGPLPSVRGYGDDRSLDTQPILDLVRRVLARLPSPYPPDITDQVCLTIENDPALMREYDSLVEHFSSRGKDGKGTVNTTIGFYTKRETGMAILKAGNPSQSKLMKSYSSLTYRR